MSDDPPPIGTMRLYSSVTPSMPSGWHRVTSTVTFESTGATPGLGGAVHRDFVNVGGSALHFSPTEVLARHPPRNATGGFDDELPHVVLRRRTLPWERPGPGLAPWLALLVFLDSEVSFATGTLSSMLPAGVVAAFGSDAEPDAPVDVVHVTDRSVLDAVLPTAAELGLLCHVRRVNLADATLDLGDDDGWLAVVVANRLPVRPGGGPGHYHACLVSLEHRDDLYAVGGQSSSLVLLHHWEFITDSDGTFARLAQDLDVSTLGAAGGVAAGVPDADGRVPLSEITRAGAADTSLYRGPFTVAATPATADARDISYDAAYEIGRVLAAADGPLTRALVDWHRSAVLAAQTSVQEASIRSLAARGGATGTLDGHATHIHAAAGGLDAVLRSLAPRVPHRRPPTRGVTDG